MLSVDPAGPLAVTDRQGLYGGRRSGDKGSFTNSPGWTSMVVTAS